MFAHIVKDNALKHLTALLEMRSTIEKAKQKLWMIKLLLIVASTNLGRLSQGNKRCILFLQSTWIYVIYSSLIAKGLFVFWCGF